MKKIIVISDDQNAEARFIRLWENFDTTKIINRIKADDMFIDILEYDEEKEKYLKACVRIIHDWRHPYDSVRIYSLEEFRDVLEALLNLAPSEYQDECTFRILENLWEQLF